MNKTLLWGGAVVVLIIAGGAYWRMSSSGAAQKSPQSGVAPSEIRVSPRKIMTRQEAARIAQKTYAAEVENVLSDETAALTTVTSDATVVEAVRTANTQNASLTLQDITRLDDAWLAAKKPTTAMQPFFDSAAAKRLLGFEAAHPEFKEIFITDAHGLNVAETDKTSDFFQADEAWWVNAFNGGAGKVFHGVIEFDQSSQAEAISLYLPVMDGGRAIGVLKGVLNLSAVSEQL
jgi:hypothetical protein